MSDLENSDVEEKDDNNSIGENSDDEEVDVKILKKVTNKEPKTEIGNLSENSDDDNDYVENSEDDLDLNPDEQIDDEGIPSKGMMTDLAEQISPVNSDVESEDEEELQKLNDFKLNEFIFTNHHESMFSNMTEINYLSQIKRDENGIIIDDNHKTIPFLTKYERTKILGQRVKQLNSGDKAYIDLDKNIIDNYIIAKKELEEKKLPVIIRRPLANSRSEYWRLEDLEII